MLDRLLEEDDLELDAVSGASAGAINAVLLASGLAKGGPDEARASLERFWSRVGESATKNLFLRPELVAATASQMSPYQFNPLELNPLRDLLAQSQLTEYVIVAAVKNRSMLPLFLPGTLQSFSMWSKAEACVSVFVSNTCGARLRSESADPSFRRRKALAV